MAQLQQLVGLYLVVLALCPVRPQYPQGVGLGGVAQAEVQPGRALAGVAVARLHLAHLAPVAGLQFYLGTQTLAVGAQIL